MTRQGLLLFNYFAGDDPGLPFELGTTSPTWYEIEIGLDNSTLFAPLEGDESEYVMINHARWDHNLPMFTARQLPGRPSAAKCWPT